MGKRPCSGTSSQGYIFHARSFLERGRVRIGVQSEVVVVGICNRSSILGAGIAYCTHSGIFALIHEDIFLSCLQVACACHKGIEGSVSHQVHGVTCACHLAADAVLHRYCLHSAARSHSHRGCCCSGCAMTAARCRVAAVGRVIDGAAGAGAAYRHCVLCFGKRMPTFRRECRGIHCHHCCLVTFLIQLYLGLCRSVACEALLSRCLVVADMTFGVCHVLYSH